MQNDITPALWLIMSSRFGWQRFGNFHLAKKKKKRKEIKSMPNWTQTPNGSTLKFQT